ncbi:ATP-binding protein [Hymenobacter sp. BT491]|uniref:PAS domain-containing sensor histidine kinase n=1 Tax=Hymenobacter sp. BT491 TaxID=2766779 RepID=UPI001653E3CA|nr:ATP-binding protein [Hymenobacter sp. BT491]MBC6991575.1 PAS domain-containing sensor histidine kinase [Hymenobacter sp. BT491]
MLDFAALFQPLAERGHLLYFAYELQARQVQYVSAAYERLLGGKVERVNEELPGLLARLHPDDQEHAANLFAQVVAGELVEDAKLRLQGPNDTTQWLCVTADLVQVSDNKKFIAGHIQDITKTRQYIDNADNFNAKKNATLEILSHDLAGPFNLVQQLAEYASEKAEVLHDNHLNELLRIIQVTCRDSVNLIQDFVDNEFMESANVELRRERTDLVESLRAVLEEYQKSEQNIAKHFEFRAPANPIYLELDNNKFMQAINNLISNSIKFTPDGGRIELSVAQPDQEYALVTVSDNGVGIPPKYQPVLFEKFTKARRPGLRGEKSTGLGMSIIKTIVELHQGRIWFESAENRGTTFYIKLPINVSN